MATKQKTLRDLLIYLLDLSDTELDQEIVIYRGVCIDYLIRDPESLTQDHLHACLGIHEFTTAKEIK